MDTKYLRNPFASHAHNRKAGPIKHRNTPRNGSRNTHLDTLNEYLEDISNLYTEDLQD